MRNLKKLLAVLVSVAVMLTAMIPAFAAEATKTDAQICYDLGMIKGATGSMTADEIAAYAAKPAARIQAAILFLRLKGLEDTARAYSESKVNFKDASQVSGNAVNLLAYLKNTPELGWQGGGTNFSPLVEATPQMVYKVMLESLGYKQNVDFTYAETIGFAKALGLKKIANVTKVTVGDFSTAIVEALKTNMKDSDQTLAAYLAKDNAAFAKAAAADGLLNYYVSAAADKESVEVGFGATATDVKAALAALKISATDNNGAKVDVAAADLTWDVSKVDTSKANTYDAVASIAGSDATVTVKVLVGKQALQVADATATNLEEIVIKFNTKLDKDTVVAANFSPAGTPTLGDDGMTVTLALTTPATANGTDYALVVKKAVKSADGVALAADYSKTVRVIDNAIPVATKAVLTGPTTFDVYFSEPIKTAGTIVVNNGVYGSTTAAPSGNKVTVTLASALAEGKYTVKVAGYKDYAGFSMDSAELELNYVKDVSPITATIDGTPSQTEVKVKFNKATATTLTVDYFYHTFTAWKPNSVSASSDKTTYTLTFTTFTIPQGSFTLVVKNTDGTTKVKDAWGNELAANINLAGSVSADTTPPTVEKAEQSTERYVDVTFSEGVNGAATAANYEVKNAAGETKAVSAVTQPDTTKNVYRLDFGANLPGGTYTVVVKNVTDKALTANTISATANSASFTITDKTAPSVTGATYVATASGTPEYIYVSFNEAMNNSALDKANYRLGASNLPDGTTIEAFGTTKVRIVLPDGTTGIAGATLYYGQLADASGNKMVALSGSVVTAPETAPVVTAITTKSLSTIEVEVGGILTSFAAEGITVDGYAPAFVSTVVKDSKTYVTLTLVSTVQLANSAAKPAQVNIVAGKWTSDTGITMNAQAITSFKDGIAPSVGTVAYVAPNTFSVAFDEALYDDNAAFESFAATDLVIVDKDGKTLTALTDYTTTISGNAVVVHLTGSTYTGYTGKLTVSSKTAVGYIFDASAERNKANAFSGKEVTMP